MKFEDYRYEYNVALTPLSKKKINFIADSLNGSNNSVKSFIEEKLKEFSLKSKESLYNSKEVDLNSINVSERVISFKLYSMEPIEIIGRSVRLFSQLVLEDKYFEDLLVKKKLFTTFIPIEKREEDEIKILDISEVSDVSLVKGLVDILPKPECEVNPEMRRAIDKMKVLAVETGIIKLK